jgi:hypothetical protein
MPLDALRQLRVHVWPPCVLQSALGAWWEALGGGQGPQVGHKVDFESDMRSLLGRRGEAGDLMDSFDDPFGRNGGPAKTLFCSSNMLPTIWVSYNVLKELAIAASPPPDLGPRGSLGEWFLQGCTKKETVKM